MPTTLTRPRPRARRRPRSASGSRRIRKRHTRQRHHRSANPQRHRQRPHPTHRPRQRRHRPTLGQTTDLNPPHRRTVNTTTSNRSTRNPRNRHQNPPIDPSTAQTGSPSIPATFQEWGSDARIRAIFLWSPNKESTLGGRRSAVLQRLRGGEPHRNADSGAGRGPDQRTQRPLRPNVAAGAHTTSANI